MRGSFIRVLGLINPINYRSKSYINENMGTPITGISKYTRMQHILKVDKRCHFLKRIKRYDISKLKEKSIEGIVRLRQYFTQKRFQTRE
jgi:hypothetical protein